MTRKTQKLTTKEKVEKYEISKKIENGRENGSENLKN